MDTNERPQRPVEQEAIRTTIVGGRPPGCGRGIGNVPRGVEVLVKKAAVDPAFRAALVEKRARAAELIHLALTPAEAAMLDIVPRAQLEAIIDRTTVHPSQLPAFLGAAAAVMLVALGATGCDSGDSRPPTKGVEPDQPTVIRVQPDNVTEAPKEITVPVEQLIAEGKVISCGLPGGCWADRPKPKADPASPTPLVGASVSGGIRATLPPAKVETPAPVISPEEAKRVAMEQAAARLKAAQDALAAFQRDNARVADFARAESRVRLYEDNPAVPGAKAKLAEAREGLKKFDGLGDDDLAAYRSRLAELQAAVKKAKAEIPGERTRMTASPNIPRGVEVLVKKAAVDPAFRAKLLDTRSKAAELIGLTLTPAEAQMIDAVPRAQLEAIINRTSVHPSQLPAFLGMAAGVMLVALGAVVVDGCSRSHGITAERDAAIRSKPPADNTTKAPAPLVPPAPENVTQPAPPVEPQPPDVAGVRAEPRTPPRDVPFPVAGAVRRLPDDGPERREEKP